MHRMVLQRARARWNELESDADTAQRERYAVLAPHLDARLAAFDAITLGLEYSLPLRTGYRLRLSGEYYSQMGERGPPDAVGILRQYDLFPGLDVVMGRVGLSREF